MKRMEEITDCISAENYKKLTRSAKKNFRNKLERKGRINEFG